MKKVKHLVEPPDSKTKLSLWKADLAQEGSFDEAIKGCTGVFHVATPMDFDSKDTEGKIKQTMDKAFWDGIMENEAGEKKALHHILPKTWVVEKMYNYLLIFYVNLTQYFLDQYPQVLWLSPSSFLLP
ncbi:hypothetical protein JHK87_047539 [Glycine soja]|nr:hypothetical protein JHK87_047539 [Glycine soja]